MHNSSARSLTLAHVQRCKLQHEDESTRAFNCQPSSRELHHRTAAAYLMSNTCNALTVSLVYPLMPCLLLQLLLQKFRINFLNVVQGSSFHKCVYILVAKEQAIMAAGAAAQQAFGKAPADYMPHLSLLYADVDDTARTASQQAAVQRLYGEGSDYKTLLTDNGFVAEAISLWYTPVEDRSLASWKQVAECPLS